MRKNTWDDLEIYKGQTMFTTTQAATALGVHRNRVLQFIYGGRLQARMLGRDYLIEDTELERFKNINRPDGRPITRKEK